MIERRARRHAQRETLRGTQTHAVGRRQWGEDGRTRPERRRRSLRGESVPPGTDESGFEGLLQRLHAAAVTRDGTGANVQVGLAVSVLAACESVCVVKTDFLPEGRQEEEAEN